LKVEHIWLNICKPKKKIRRMNFYQSRWAENGAHWKIETSVNSISHKFHECGRVDSILRPGVERVDDLQKTDRKYRNFDENTVPHYFYTVKISIAWSTGVLHRRFQSFIA